MWIRRATYDTLVRNSATFEKWAHDLLASEQRLLERIEELKESLAAERARSDIAVDRLLEQRGSAPITPIKAPSLEELSSMFEESPEEVRAIRADIKERGAANVLLRTD